MRTIKALFISITLLLVAAGSVSSVQAAAVHAVKQLKVLQSKKKYKYFQFYGGSYGAVVGEVSLNGVVMQKLDGGQSQTSDNRAQKILHQGENVIRIHIEKFVGPGPQEFEYAILAVAANESGNPFDSDHVVDLQDDLSHVSPLPATIEYRFDLKGPAFTVLKAKH